MTTLHSIFPKREDERIRDDVRRQLMWQTDIQSEEIAVQVKDSAVVLTGRVETCLERREAESAAMAAYGVSSVTNRIRIEPKRARPDREIADDVLACLRIVICVLEELPTVSVRDGVVTLRGRVRWKFQAVSAERAAEAVVGVLRVRNLIEVMPPGAFASTGKKQDAALSALKRNDPQPDCDCRPLFFVPSVVGRA
ncbi:MAG TPA: BON domain-containing protein [Edaphobacter sp.]